jgi:hypothetical protein
VRGGIFQFSYIPELKKKEVKKQWFIISLLSLFMRSELFFVKISP